MRTLARRGLRVLGLLSMLSLATTTGTGCLITDPIDIPEEENYPPSIVSDLAAPEPRYPIEEIVTLDRSVDESLTFSVIVRDPNIEQDLEYVVLKDFDPESPGVTFLVRLTDLASTGELDRPRSFTIDGDLLALFTRGQCHKLELRVSSSLDANAQPEEEDDLAVAVWWVNSLSDDGTPTDLASCPD